MSGGENVYLGLGSNKGSREQLLAKAIELLSNELGTPVSLSTIIETRPLGFSSPNMFLNMVAQFNTDIPPFSLLDITERVERCLGRTVKTASGAVYSDRPIDIDILLYGDRIINSERLTVPHPRMHERSFVLVPLAEIAPNLMHPTMCKSVLDLKNNLSD